MGTNSDLALCPEALQHDAGMVVEWGTLGRLKPDDIPAAAVDFHISSIIEDLLGKPNILTAASKAAAKTGSDPAAALKSAMWHFSGSCNHRSQLQVPPSPCGASSHSAVLYDCCCMRRRGDSKSSVC